jgi:hypothetical protein
MVFRKEKAVFTQQEYNFAGVGLGVAPRNFRIAFLLIRRITYGSQVVA